MNGNLQKFKSRFKNLIADKAYALDLGSRDIFELEKRIFILFKLNNDIKLIDGWSVFTKYFDDLRCKNEEKKVLSDIYILRKSNNKYSKQGKWKRLIASYLNIPMELRIFDIDENGYIKRITAKYENDREKYIEISIEEDYKESERELNYPDNEIIYNSKRFKQNEVEMKTYKTNKIIEEINTEYKGLPRYRQKKFITIRSDEEWGVLFKLMGKNFENRPVIELEILNGATSLEIKDLIHIVGALGAGKSTFKYVTTFKEVKENKLRFGIVEENVGNVISTVENLRELGIKAVPIIGTSNELKYLRNYYSSLEDKEKIDDNYILKCLSGSCILKALVDDEENIAWNPCRKLKEDNKSVTCHYWEHCGGMLRQRDLIEAEVMVTTPHSLVKGILPEFIDIHQRSIYELFYDVLDLIIVDEADGIQSILDSQLMPSAHLNHGNDNILNDLKKFSSDIKKSNGGLGSINVYSIVKNTLVLEENLVVAERIITKFNKLNNYIKNKIVTPIEVMKDIAGILRKDESNERLIGFLESYVSFTDTYDIKEETIDHELNILFNKIKSIHLIEDGYPETRLKDEVITYMKVKGVNLPTNKKGRDIDDELFVEKVCFLILLVQIDYTLKFINNEYEAMKLEVNNDSYTIAGLQGLSSRIINLVKEPCLGTIYGYKFTRNSGLDIDVLRYEGVGRSLLENWSKVKSHICLEGPAVVCLSGTSFSPGSAHYNLKRTPDILLKGKKEGNIKMTFLPKIEDGGYIKISGSGMDFKEINLKDLTRNIVRDIRYQLEKIKGKVLIVVNSHDDCITVGEVLNYNKLNYKIVGKEESEVDNMITKDNLENFRELTKGADICVVPLSIISRGYNILDTNGDSYFGSMFFMIRPYMVPGDFNSYVQILHHSLNTITEGVSAKYIDYGTRLAELRKLCYVAYKKILEISYWAKLDPSEREIMSWFMIVPIKQAIGRMQRNGNDCEVFFCDISFCNALAKIQGQNVENSIFYAWREILRVYIDDKVINTLYGNFYEALEKMIDDIENQISINGEMEGDY